jgi:hypothetical protein
MNCCHKCSLFYELYSWVSDIESPIGRPAAADACAPLDEEDRAGDLGTDPPPSDPKE